MTRSKLRKLVRDRGTAHERTTYWDTIGEISGLPGGYKVAQLGSGTKVVFSEEWYGYLLSQLADLARDEGEHGLSLNQWRIEVDAQHHVRGLDAEPDPDVDDAGAATLATPASSSGAQRELRL
jgi:hypothetical protein